MLLELADYYSLLFLAPFLALEIFWRARRYDAPRGWRLRALAVSLAAFGVSFAVGPACGRRCCRNGAWSTARRSAPGAGPQPASCSTSSCTTGITGRPPLGLAVAPRAPDAPQRGERGRLRRVLPASARRGILHHLGGARVLPGARPHARGRRHRLAFLAFNAAFQHANIRTPRWLGYLSSGRKATACTTGAASIATTTPTCRCGTWSSALPQPGRRRCRSQRASTAARRRGSGAMLAFREP